MLAVMVELFMLTLMLALMFTLVDRHIWRIAAGGRLAGSHCHQVGKRHSTHCCSTGQHTSIILGVYRVRALHGWLAIMSIDPKRVLSDRVAAQYFHDEKCCPATQSRLLHGGRGDHTCNPLLF